MNELIKTTSIGRTVITKDNYDKGSEMFWHIKHIQRSIDSSCEYMRFKKCINAEAISLFPISKADIIRHTITKHILKKENVTDTEIVDEVLDRLYKGELPYLLFDDSDRYWKLNNVMIYKMDTTKGYDYLKEDIFPIIDKCLRVPSSEESVNELIGEVYGRGDIPDDKYTLKLWNAYCKYREDMLEDITRRFKHRGLL